MTRSPNAPRVWINNQLMHGTLHIADNTQTVWTEGPQPDPNWSHVDEARHFHARDDEGGLPTLDAVPEHVDCGCETCNGEGYTITHWHCRICREEITPGSIPGLHSTTIPVGPSEWTVEIADPPPDVAHAERVSVRVEMGETVLFGVATVEPLSVSSQEARFLLRGDGPLSSTAATLTAQETPR